jgi:hypothetical protein
MVIVSQSLPVVSGAPLRADGARETETVSETITPGSARARVFNTPVEVNPLPQDRHLALAPRCGVPHVPAGVVRGPRRQRLDDDLVQDRLGRGAAAVAAPRLPCLADAVCRRDVAQDGGRSGEAVVVAAGGADLVLGPLAGVEPVGRSISPSARSRRASARTSCARLIAASSSARRGSS